MEKKETIGRSGTITVTRASFRITPGTIQKAVRCLFDEPCQTFEEEWQDGDKCYHDELLFEAWDKACIGHEDGCTVRYGDCECYLEWGKRQRKQ